MRGFFMACMARSCGPMLAQSFTLLAFSHEIFVCALVLRLLGCKHVGLHGIGHCRCSRLSGGLWCENDRECAGRSDARHHQQEKEQSCAVLTVTRPAPDSDKRSLNEKPAQMCRLSEKTGTKGACFALNDQPANGA